MTNTCLFSFVSATYYFWSSVFLRSSSRRLLSVGVREENEIADPFCCTDLLVDPTHTHTLSFSAQLDWKPPAVGFAEHVNTISAPVLCLRVCVCDGERECVCVSRWGGTKRRKFLAGSFAIFLTTFCRRWCSSHWNEFYLYKIAT